MSKKSQKCSGGAEADCKSKYYAGSRKIIFDGGMPPYCEAARDYVYDAVILHGKGLIDKRCDEFLSYRTWALKQMCSKSRKTNDYGS
jgi:hypothetical protein